MGKIIITILLLANICFGYFAEAYQGETCDSISFQSECGYFQDTLPVAQDCLAIHCHFGHCANLKKIDLPQIGVVELYTLDFKTVLYPIDFVLDVLRPPIFA